MAVKNAISIYNASAGSGKTFSLVREYLLLLFSSKSPLTFRKILALTFTNKAVGEMKTRIIQKLQEFSEESVLTSKNDMFTEVMNKLNIEPIELHNKSKRLLETIVHNYAAFDISTIDKFNHRLIRVFAHDLKLPVNFEVELNTEDILNKAVDKLIDRAGTNDELTTILVDFAIEKTDDDRSWDISYDFKNIAKLLVNENEIPFIETLKNKTLSQFKDLKGTLQKKVKALESQINNTAENTLKLISSTGLEFSDFSRSTLPNHFKKAGDLNFNALYSNKLEENIKERKNIYTRSLGAEKASSIESLLPAIEEAYLIIKRAVYQSSIYNNALRNITPLSVLNAIQQSLIEIKNEEDLLLISEFNSIINAEIKTQPAPFIYERIGEKFKHFFIDEFQDTSILQWENLVPLIGNAISGESLTESSGSLMLVGDAKQAIYRWRGGRAEQFINLYSGDNPFFLDANLQSLPSNYRSFKEVIKFNNGLFQHISEMVFTSKIHSNLYQNSKQKFEFEQDGYVNLNFLKIEDESKDEAYCKATLNTIERAKLNGFQLKEICLIVRKKKEGIAIAEFLSEKGVPIISSETLLIDNSLEVKFLNHLIALNVNPKDELSKARLLSYLAEYQLKLEDTHSFLMEMMALKHDKFFDALKSYGYEFNMDVFSELPIYEAVESAIRIFNLNQESNAYIQFYLDEILDYSQKSDSSFQGFVTHWESKKERLGIVSPEGKEAIQIMTIHKSKGLEFPVVIFPYANQDIYFDLHPKIWFPVDKEKFSDFPYLYLSLNKDLEEYSDLGKLIYEDYRANLELDSINLLYVVLTRAIEQLYVISELDLDKNGTEKPSHYSGLLIGYLKQLNLFDSNQLIYDFGAATKISERQQNDNETEELMGFISTSKESHDLAILTNAGLMWDTKKADALERGNLVHDIMARIVSIDDLEGAIRAFEISGKLSPEQSNKITSDIEKIISHPKLKEYYVTKNKVYNERDILSKSGKILRPDRLIINESNEIAIIDYKTGLPNPKHKEQLYDYQSVLEEMDFKISKKFLVYVNESIVLKEF